MDVRIQKGISDSGQVQDSDATTVFLAWAKLRFFFNAVLASVVLVFLFLTGRQDSPHFWYRVALDAVVANVCFCAGPVAEGHLCWLLRAENE